MTKREAFQRMLARVRAQGDVDYVIVYMLSRMARNRYDDAIVMADLRKRGVTLVSATEAVDDSPVGQLMHGILATFNEYQSRQSGADIANKMGQKARTGGTLGRAKIGYLNHIDHSDGRVIRTIVLDDERASFVQPPSSCTTPATTRSMSWPTNSTTAAYAPALPPSTRRRRSRSTSSPKCCGTATTSAT